MLPDDPTYSAANGWTAAILSSTPGYVAASITPPGSGNVVSTGGGTLVYLNFLVLPNAPLGVSNIDLAADTAAGPPVSTLSDGTDDIGGAPYTLQPNPVDNTGDVQTITFGGTINAGTTFTLGYNGTPTGPIAYSSTAATLQSNIQTALDNNTAIGAGNTLVIANSPTSVTVTFQGTLGNASMQPLLTVSSQLTGTNASVNVVDSGFGYYGLPSNDAALADPVDGSVQVTGSNTPPTANNDAYSITERDVGTDPGLIVATGPISLTANDVSPIGNVLSTSLVTAPSHGTVVINGDQTVTFTGAAGGDTFQLLYANFTTTAINYSSTPATLQANIQNGT